MNTPAVKGTKRRNRSHSGAVRKRARANQYPSDHIVYPREFQNTSSPCTTRLSNRLASNAGEQYQSYSSNVRQYENLGVSASYRSPSTNAGQVTVKEFPRGRLFDSWSEENRSTRRGRSRSQGARVRTSSSNLSKGNIQNFERNDANPPLPASPLREYIPHKAGVALEHLGELRNPVWAILFALSFSLVLSSADMVNNLPNFSPFQLQEILGFSAATFLGLLFCAFLSNVVLIAAISGLGFVLAYNVYLWSSYPVASLAVLVAYGGAANFIYTQLETCLKSLTTASVGLINNPHLLFLTIFLQLCASWYWSLIGEMLSNQTDTFIWVGLFLQRFWVCEFIAYVVEFTTARTLAFYWMSSHSKFTLSSRVTESGSALVFALSSSMGTLAGFSFVSATSIAMKKVSGFIHKKIRANAERSWVWMLFSHVYNYITTLAAILSELNLYSVVYAAVECSSFVPSTTKAFKLVKSNPMQMAVTTWFQYGLVWGGMTILTTLTTAYSRSGDSTFFDTLCTLYSNSRNSYYALCMLSTAMKTYMTLHLEHAEYKDHLKPKIE